MNPFKLIKSMFTSAPRLHPLECAASVRAGESILIDVREPREWASGVAQHAKLLPLSDLTGSRTQWQRFLADHADKEMLFYCAHGGRSVMAARILAAEGFRTANAGSITDWVAAGWPLVKPDASSR